MYTLSHRACRKTLFVRPGFFLVVAEWDIMGELWHMVFMCKACDKLGDLEACPENLTFCIWFDTFWLNLGVFSHKPQRSARCKVYLYSMFMSSLTNSLCLLSVLEEFHNSNSFMCTLICSNLNFTVSIKIVTLNIPSKFWRGGCISDRLWNYNFTKHLYGSSLLCKCMVKLQVS